jgi:ribonuclease HII
MPKNKKIQLIAGVDEAGRGPLAGPVYAAAVILDDENLIQGLADSKKLTEAKREFLFKEICEKAKAFSVAYASVEEIDEINILQASLLAMKRAVETLSLEPELILFDGNFCPVLSNKTCKMQAIIKGDETIQSISAASILAKVSRDREMHRWEKIYPGYGFSEHKGYATERHCNALKRLGATAIHRKTFAPVREAAETFSNEKA